MLRGEVLESETKWKAENIQETEMPCKLIATTIFEYVTKTKTVALFPVLFSTTGTHTAT